MVEILLFEKTPSGSYEFINPCKYIGCETEGEPDVRGEDKSDEYDDVEQDTYDKISHASPTPPRKPAAAAASSERLSRESVSPYASCVFSKDDSKQKPTVVQVTPKSYPHRTNLTKETVAEEPPNMSVSSSNKQQLHAGDNLIYEVVNVDTGLGVKAECQRNRKQNTIEDRMTPHADRSNFVRETKPKEKTSSASTKKQPPDAGDDLIYEVVNVMPKAKCQQATKLGSQNSCEAAKTSAAEQLYTVPHAGVRSNNKPPPPTKPKTFRWNVTEALPGDAESARTAVCRVNPVQPFVDGDDSSREVPGGRAKPRWKSARDVPANLEDLSVEQVADCMELLHLPQLAQAFKLHDVDGKLLLSIVSEEVLITDFHCRTFDARKVVQFVKNRWRPNE